MLTVSLRRNCDAAVTWSLWGCFFLFIFAQPSFGFSNSVLSRCQFHAACCWNNPLTSWECSLTPWTHPPTPPPPRCPHTMPARCCFGWPLITAVCSTHSVKICFTSFSRVPLLLCELSDSGKSTERLMLPERCLEWRKCFSELLSKIISLRTAQYSTSELNTHRYPFCQRITCKIYFVFCLKAIKLNTVGFFFSFAARAAEKQSEWIRPSKGLPERAPFPPGHILHYPENDSHEGQHTHASTHTRTHTHASSENRNYLSLIRRCQWLFYLIWLWHHLLCK